MTINNVPINVLNDEGWASLVRVSSDEQYKEGESFEVQRQKNVNYINDKGGKLFREYLEDGVSAFKKRIKHRPQMLQLIKDIETGKVKYIIAYNRDRVVRIPEDYYMLRGIFSEYGVEVHFTSPTETPWTNSTKKGRKDPTGVLMSGLRPLLSEFECNTTSQRVYDTVLPLVQKGVWRCGRPPYGYVYNKEAKRVEQVPHQAEVCRKIRDMYAKGIGAGKISYLLNNELKIPYESPAIWHKPETQKKPRNYWYEGVVTAIVAKPVYMGIQVWDGQWYECPAIDAIFTKEEWQEAYEIYQGKLNKKTPHKYYNTTFLFKDILYCAYCGSRLIPTYKTSKYLTLDGSESIYEYYHYKCEGRWERHTNCKQKKHNRKHIEQAIINIVASNLNDMDIDRVYDVAVGNLRTDIKDYQNKVARLQKETAEIQIKIDRNIDAYENSTSDVMRKQLERKAEGYDKELQQKERELNELLLTSPDPDIGEAVVAKTYESMRRWQGIMNNPEISREEKRMLALEIIDRMTVTNEGMVDVKFKVDQQFPKVKLNIIKAEAVNT